MSRCDEVIGGISWQKIGVDGQKSLWARFTHPTKVELCAGRGGDDDYLSIDESNPQFKEIYNILLSAVFAGDAARDTSSR